MRRKNLYIFSIILVIIIIFIISRPNQFGDINTKKISIEELITYGEKNSNRVAKQFSDKYGISSFGKKFWKTDYNDEKPIDELYIAALNDLKDHIIVSQIAEELEIIEPVSFSSEKKEWQKNGNGLELWQFLDNKDSQLIDKIKTELLKKEPPTNEELRESFDQLDDKYKKSEYMIEAVEIITDSEDKEKLEEIAEEILPDSNLEQILSYFKKSLPDSFITSFHLKSEEIQKEDIYSIAIGEILSGTPVGEIVTGYHEQQFFYTVNKEGGQLLTFEEAPKFGETYFINKKYDEKIDAYKKEVSVKLTKEAKKQFIKHFQN